MKQSKATRRITLALSAILLSEQLAGTGAVLYAHAENEEKTEYSIEQSVTSSWDGGCNANIILTNLADKDTQDWSVVFCSSDKITNLWGGEITECIEFSSFVEEEQDEEYEEYDEAFAEDWFLDESFEKEAEVEGLEKPEDKETVDAPEVSADKMISETDKDIDAEEGKENHADAENEGVGENATETDPENEIVDENYTDTKNGEDAGSEMVSEDEASENAVVITESKDVFVESQEYDFDEPVVGEYEVYYRYTVKALDYNAVIAAGASITIGYCAEGNDHGVWDEKALLTFKEASVPVGGTYEYDGYTVEVKIPSCWDGTYNVRLLITNTSDETLHNWAFVMDTKDTISGLYNAVEMSGNDNEEDNVHLIKNAGYNQDIPAGGTVEVGYTASYEGDTDVPGDFALSQIEMEVTTAECEVSLLISDEWENGGLAQIIIRNISQLPIEDWMIEFDSVLDIREIWGGVIECHEGEHYFIRNSGYAQNILPGESWTVGVLFSGESAEISNVQVKQIAAGNNNNAADGILSVSADHMAINEDGNYEFAEDFTAFTGTLVRVNEVTKFTLQVFDKNDIKIYETDIVPAEQWTLEDFAFIYGLDRFAFEVYFGAERYAVELIVNCNGNHNFDKLVFDHDDSDGDGLINYFEKYFGTDENDVDTDDDELTDYQELYTFGYDPLNPDSDGDGLADKDEDADEDGISNKKEYNLGSDPISIDSDKDRLLDSIEISYGTSLILEDTDNDGVSDYDEYMLDQIGVIRNSDGTYTATFSADTMGCAYDKAVIPSITLTGDTSAILDFSTTMVTGNYLLNPSMVGYMGQAYDFSTTGDMNNAELTFTYDERYIDERIINATDFCPTIYYFDSDNQDLIEVENQTWIGNKVIAHLEHFSTYILADKSALEAFWNRPLEEISEPDMFETEYDDDQELNFESKKATVRLNVTYSNGIAVPNADVYVYSIDTYGRYGTGGVMLYSGVDLQNFQMSTRTDKNGRAICHLNSESVDSTGCYIIFVDQDGKYGASYTIASPYWEHIHDGLTAGEERDIDIILEPYSSSEEVTVSFGVHSNAYTLPNILYSYNIRLYEGWGFSAYAESGTPVIDEISWEKAFWRETYQVTVPRGKYTAIIEKEGYPKKKLQILVPGDIGQPCGMNQPFLVLMNGENSIIVSKTEEEYNFDINNDGLNDELTKLICKGGITTRTGTKVFYGNSWLAEYNDVMSNSDWDDDGLINGDEIEIYYKDGRPYIKMLSHPQIIDSDFDMIWDDEEINLYNTDPNNAEAIVFCDDLNALNRRRDFEAAKAYDDYLGENSLWLNTQLTFNFILGGGELSRNRMASEELLELFALYADQNRDECVEIGQLNSINSILSEIGDISELCGRKFDYTFFNDLSRKMRNARRSSEASIAIMEISKDLQEWVINEFVKIGGTTQYAEELSRWIGKAGILLTIGSAGLVTVQDVTNYNATVELLKDYEYILYNLKCCGNVNIENAAINVSRDMQDIYTKYLTNAGNIIWNASESGIGYIAAAEIAGLGIPGLIADIVLVATNAMVGNAGSNKIVNFTDVDCVNAVTLATNNLISYGTYQGYGAANVIVVVPGRKIRESKYGNIKWFKEEINAEGEATYTFLCGNDVEESKHVIDIVRFNAFAWKWAETKYIGYLDSDRKGMNGDFFFESVSVK
ncbi:MAG: cellulose binding domain-containing protein [Lachnospiraceae bacterium]|nr:cellulose binding domain-containing protein [Lachnospiraceae bacterium]